jgi:hypothetical protein
MRSSMVAVFIAFCSFVWLPVMADDQRPSSNQPNWTKIAEGVFEADDSCGGRRFLLEGEEGVRWRILQLESRLEALGDDSGQTPPGRAGEAAGIRTQLKTLYELVKPETDDPPLAPGCLDTPDIESGSGSCENQSYSYYAYACGRYTELGVSTPYGYATASLSSCSGGWSGKAEASTYRDSGVEETDYDSSGWSQTPQASSSLPLRSSSTCGYAWSRVTVCYNCVKAEGLGGDDTTYYIYEAEHDYPNGCY